MSDDKRNVTFTLTIGPITRGVCALIEEAIARVACATVATYLGSVRATLTVEPGPSLEHEAPASERAPESHIRNLN